MCSPHHQSRSNSAHLRDEVVNVALAIHQVNAVKTLAPLLGLEEKLGPAQRLQHEDVDVHEGGEPGEDAGDDEHGRQATRG